MVDLESGAGNDCFVARHETGETGKVMQFDFTEVMRDKAQISADQRGFNYVEFRLGDIEKLPITANVAGVVVSNCVMNLVPDKAKAFGEVFRILKLGGLFSISDIVLTGDLPEKIKNAVEMYDGCAESALLKDYYLQIIKNTGFTNILLQKVKQIIVPNDI